MEKTDYWHCHETYRTITSYEDGTYKIEVQGLYRENESKTGQIVGPHTDVIIYDYQKKSALIGDVNGDGEVSIIDATLIQRHLAQLVFLEDEQLIFADTTGDGEVDITDATQIQRYLAYFIPSLG